MKIKATIAAFVLVLSPASAFAYCSGAAHAAEEVTMSCAEGTTFDPDTNTCVAETIG